MQAFREFKGIWDPEGKMNPDKVVDPYKLDENLRLGADYHPREPETQFAFPEDDGSFPRGAALRRRREVPQARTAARCVRATWRRARKNTRRAVARACCSRCCAAKSSPTAGETTSVKEALDLCLACKGCKGECPVGVDMATYKAEFLSHYYERRMRPRSAYAMGLMQYWARVGGRMPRLANFVSHSPVLSPALKRMGGVAAEREIPPFATQTFRQWFRGHQPRRGAKGRVILWPDTWNNYFHPDVARAAVEVLEAADYEVTIPQASSLLRPAPFTTTGC